jgi:hypothetical protein
VSCWPDIQGEASHPDGVRALLPSRASRRTKVLGRSRCDTRRFALSLSALTLTFLFCFSSAPALAEREVTLVDGDFMDWSWTVLLEEGVGWGNVTRMETGGNPDAFIEVGTPSGWELHMWVLMWKEGFIWDPSGNCEIEQVTLEIDEIGLNTFGQGQNIKLLLVQGDSYFAGPLVPWLTITHVEPTWETHVLGPVTQDNFFGLLPLPYNPGGKPDFGPTGAPIRVGFMVGVSSVLDAKFHGYDDWKITVQCVGCSPTEPSTWGKIKGLYT